MRDFTKPFITLIFMVLVMLPTPSAAAKNASKNNNTQLDDFAENYVKLGLELGEYDKDYVDAYLGPKQWLQQAKKNLRSKQQLGKDIHSLYLQVQKYAPSLALNKTRQKSLTLNLRAMDTRVRMLNGEKFSFEQEARLIYDVKLPQYGYAEFDKTLSAIDKLIPGDGELSTRVDSFLETFNVPKNKVKPVVDAAIAECRRRSAEHISLPENESFTLEYVTHKNWSGYNWYQGNNHSLMQINQDAPLKIDRALSLGCHEGYPGHHVWNILVENNLLKHNNWIEFSIFPLFSPYALIAEGSANYGIDMAFPEHQKIDFEVNTLFPLAGLDPQTAITLTRLKKLTKQLSHASTATAQLYLDGKISRQQALQKIIKYGLINPIRAEQSIKFIEQYRAYVLNYNLGQDIVSEYVEAQSDTTEGRWKAFEKMLTHLSTASDMLE